MYNPNSFGSLPLELFCFKENFISKFGPHNTLALLSVFHSSGWRFIIYMYIYLFNFYSLFCSWSKTKKLSHKSLLLSLPPFILKILSRAMKWAAPMSPMDRIYFILIFWFFFFSPFVLVYWVAVVIVYFPSFFIFYRKKKWRGSDLKKLICPVKWGREWSNEKGRGGWVRLDFSYSTFFLPSFL